MAPDDPPSSKKAVSHASNPTDAVSSASDDSPRRESATTFTFANGLEGWTIDMQYTGDRASRGDGGWSEQYGGSVRLHVDGAPSALSFHREVGALERGTRIRVNYESTTLQGEPGGPSLQLRTPSGDAYRLDIDNRRNDQNGTLIGEVPQDVPDGTVLNIKNSVWPGAYTIYVTNITIGPTSADTAMRLSFEDAAAGAARPPDPWNLTMTEGGHQISAERATHGSQSLYLAGSAGLGQTRASIAVDLTDVATIRGDIYVQSSNHFAGDIKVHIDNTSGKVMGVTQRTAGQWYTDLGGNVSRYEGEHSLILRTRGEENRAYFDNLRFYDVAGNLIPPSEVIVADDGSQSEPATTFTFANGLEGWTIDMQYTGDRASRGDGGWSEQYGGSVRLRVDGAPSALSFHREVGALDAGTRIRVNYESDTLQGEPGGPRLQLRTPSGDAYRLDIDNRRNDQNGTLIGEVPQDVPDGTILNIGNSVWPGAYTIYVTNVTIGAPSTHTVLRDVTVDPNEVTEGRTVTHTLTLNISNVSDDGNTDTITVNFPSAVENVSPNSVSVADAEGDTVLVTGADTSGTRYTVSVSPDSAADTRDLTATVSVDVTYPNVDAETTASITASVSDSSFGSEQADAEVVISDERESTRDIDLANADARLNSAGSGGSDLFWWGQALGVQVPRRATTGVQLHLETDEAQDSTLPIGEVSLDSDGEGLVRTGTIPQSDVPGDFVLAADSNTFLLVDDGQITGTTSDVDQAEFEIATQTLRAEFTPDDPDANENTTLELLSNRGSYRMYVTAESASDDELLAFFGQVARFDATDVDIDDDGDVDDDGIRIQVASTDIEQELNVASLEGNQPDTFEFDVIDVVNTTASADLAVRTGTQAPDTGTTLALSPSDQTVAPGNTVTYNIVVGQTSDGVGSFNLGVAVADPSTATIVDASTTINGVSRVEIAGDNASVQLGAYDGGEGVPDSGTDVRIATVTIRGETAGSTELVLAPESVSDENGADQYTLEEVTNASVTVAADPVTLRLVPTEASVGTGGTTTLEIVADGIERGVGGYELQVNSTDVSTAVITAAEPTIGGTGRTDLAGDGSGVLMGAFSGDTNRTGPVTIGTVTVEGVAPGTVEVPLRVGSLSDEAGSPYTVGTTTDATMTVRTAPDVTGDGNPATDPDRDGLYEDVNGDGTATPGDATVLFNAAFENTPAVMDNVALFDFNDDGSVTPGDATVLFNEVFE